MAIVFGTKSETLERLEGAVAGAYILPQERIDWASWSSAPQTIIARIAARGWINEPIIVRSSAIAEDSHKTSLAGRYLSVKGAIGREEIEAAIGRVFDSYGDERREEDQVFVQPLLEDVTTSGVALTRDPNSGAPYIVINYSVSNATDSVTAGSSSDLQTFYYCKHASKAAPGFLDQIVELAHELERLFQHDAIDFEFAVSRARGLCLLQARPLVINAPPINSARHRKLLEGIARRIAAGRNPHPYLYGRSSIFGVMPDWNPAEVIGTRPRPLALSLYRNLVTDHIWAYQRSNYGYKNLRSFPLVVSFCGLPYVDVRVSFNSFVPVDISDDISNRLVDFYLEQLRTTPALHDKVEFEIVFSCYSLDLPRRLATLTSAGFGEAEVESLGESLRCLTNRIICGKPSLWRADLDKIGELEKRRQLILHSDLDCVSRIYWLLEDCKRWGTLPFAGLARAAFIAVQMLRSMVSAGVMTEQQYASFISDVDTVTSEIIRDGHGMDRAQFLEKYGHLRPGTYDILSSRYDETPEKYLADAHQAMPNAPGQKFQLTSAQQQHLERLLVEHRLEMSAMELLDFIKHAIRGREYAKFMFTRSLSDAISLLKELGAQNGLNAEEMSFAEIPVIEELYTSAGDAGEYLKERIRVGRERYHETRHIVLPPVISEPEEVWSFHFPPSEPNYVTQGIAEGTVRSSLDAPESLAGAIVFITNADPGFDWIFSRRIAGLVTAYGGINSHMAIRAAECGVPSVIGAGEVLYQTWLRAARLRLDCANRRVEILQI